jgi:malate permease and related proteins
MQLFTHLLLSLLPLYMIIGLGFISAKFLNVQKESIAKLLIYVISPVVIFYGTLNVDLNSGVLILPVLIFFISSIISVIFLFIGKVFFKNSTLPNILAFTSGTGNTGYFGLPVINILLGEKAFNIAVLGILGFIFFENTIGYYLVSKGNYSTKESIKKIITLPTIYGFLVGLGLNLTKIPSSEILINTAQYFKGSYTLLGMMIVGMGIAGLNLKMIDYKFITLSFLAKFMVWPILISFLILADKNTLNFLSPLSRSVLLVFSIVPLAANTIAVATELKSNPEKASASVFLSTFFALFFIPLFVVIFNLK